MKIDTQTFNNLCYEVKQSTKNNDHTNALLLVAKYFELHHFIKVFEFIRYMHFTEGHLKTDLHSIRERESKIMMFHIKELFNDNVLDVVLFDKLSNSF